MAMATSVSASRWRTAWNEAIGRPNWMRVAGVLAGQLEHGPGGSDQLVGEGQASERHGGGPVAGRRGHLAPG